MNDPIPVPVPVPDPATPTPFFTTSPPASAPVGAVTIALKADIHHAPKYTLTVTRDGVAVAPPANLQSGNAQVPSTAIDIPTTGTGNLVIPSAYFANLGAGNYSIKITANSLMLPGAGTTSTSFTLTLP
jgi:hypothetical protein